MTKYENPTKASRLGGPTWRIQMSMLRHIPEVVDRAVEEVVGQHDDDTILTNLTAAERWQIAEKIGEYCGLQITDNDVWDGDVGGLKKLCEEL